MIFLEFILSVTDIKLCMTVREATYKSEIISNTMALKGF